MLHVRLVSLCALCTLGSLICSSASYAGVYFVDDDGAASWADCEHDAAAPGPKSGSDACSLATANANVAPGDIVYLRAGTYYPTSRSDCIHPGQSGAEGNRIVYENYGGETVTIDGANSDLEAILFSAGYDTGDPADGRSYITIRGLNFDNWNQLGELRYASYNEIAYCNFYGHKGDGTNVDYNGFFIYQESRHNWIRGNTWHSFGHFVGQDGGCLLNVGHDVGGTADNSGNDYNTVENNHFYASGHHVVGVNNAKYNVIRNNYIHNEGWSTTGACSDWDTGVCGYRVMSMTDGSGLDVAGSNLLEDNNIAYGAQYGGPHLITGASGSGLTLDTAGNIVRYNKFFGNVMFGIRIGSSIGASNGSNNRIFNNTIFYSGYNLDSWGVVNEDDAGLTAWGDSYRSAFALYGDACNGTLDNNIIKNNLAHEIWSETNNLSGSSYYPAFYEGSNGGEACNTMVDNWGNSGASQSSPFTPYPDPMFVDPDVSDPMTLTLVNGDWTGSPNLSLQGSSPVIDTGVPLTQATGAGSSSTTLLVDDARYFQDGTWGSDLARIDLHADWIAIGTVANVVQVSAVDHEMGTIELAAPMTWEDGASVWLYRKSNGEIVLFGAAPEMGAHEYSPPDSNCTDLNGTCCGVDQVCEGGFFENSVDCGWQCCLVGTCQDPVDPNADGGTGDGDGGTESGDGGTDGRGEETGCGCTTNGQSAVLPTLLWLLPWLMLAFVRRRRSATRPPG